MKKDPYRTFVPACPPAAPDAAWPALDTVDMAEKLRCPVPALQDMLPFMRAAGRAVLTAVLQQFRGSAERTPALDEAPASRA